jgi:peptidase E
MINVFLSLKETLFDPELNEYLKEIITPKDKVCSINFSYFEKDFKYRTDYENTYSKKGSYTKKLKSVLKGVGVDPHNVTVVDYFNDNYNSAHSKINNADIIYLPGGSPIEFMHRCEEFEITKDLFKEKKLIIGSSCGALVQLNWFHLTPDSDIDHFVFSHGLGIFSSEALIDVHYIETDEFKYSREIVQKLNYDYLIRIPNDGFLVCEDGEVVLEKNLVWVNLEKD